VKPGLLALLNIFTQGILVYFLLINAVYMLFIVMSAFGILRHFRWTRFLQTQDIFSSPMAKPISIIAPAFNEEAGIVESIRSLLSLEYPQFEVIVVNDGSTDTTLAQLIETFSLKPVHRIYRKVLECKPIRGIYTSSEYPQLVLVDKVNGGKADALNAGLNISRYPLFCAIDGDSLLDRDSLLRVVRPFLEDPERVMAVGGVIRLSNGCLVRHGQAVCLRLPKNNLARFQILEYFRAFLGGRMGMSMLRSMIIVSGAFGIFRKDIALACGGYNPNAIGEDLDLVVRIRRHCYRKKIPHRIVFVPDPICWTQAPESWRVLARQRGRWQRGLIQTFHFYGRMVFNPRYGLVGMFALPFYLVFELLGPIIEILGYLTFVLLIFWHKVDYPFALLFFTVSVVLGTLLSISSIFLEELSSKRYPRFRDIFILGAYSVLENLYYRQFLSLVRAKAFLDYFRGRNVWGAMEKKGFEKT
jgi:cellulose synthase/poly-beta-1,6-N-acetylglucosamine synthase-like glycosyltransferase